MAINPILFNGTINMTQDLSALKAHNDNQSTVMHSHLQTKVDQKVEENVTKVRNSDNVDYHEKGFDASEKGDNEYQGDGGKRRRKQERDRVVVKNKGGFDISV